MQQVIYSKTRSNPASRTRYAKTRNAALFGQAITAPIVICFTAICGIIIASATQIIYGEVMEYLLVDLERAT